MNNIYGDCSKTYTWSCFYLNINLLLFSGYTLDYLVCMGTMFGGHRQYNVRVHGWFGSGLRRVIPSVATDVLCCESVKSS